MQPLSAVEGKTTRPKNKAFVSQKIQIFIPKIQIYRGLKIHRPTQSIPENPNFCHSRLRHAHKWVFKIQIRGPFINSVTRDAAFFRLGFTPLPFVTLTFSRISARHAVFYCCSLIFSVFWARVTLNFAVRRPRHARKFPSIYPPPSSRVTEFMNGP